MSLVDLHVPTDKPPGHRVELRTLGAWRADRPSTLRHWGRISLQLVKHLIFKPLPQKWGLYATVMSVCLFVRLSPEACSNCWQRGLIALAIRAALTSFVFFVI